MFARFAQETVQKRLAQAAAVVLLGPRQVGKTTLAKTFLGQASMYLDLEDEADLARLSNPRQYLDAHLDKLLILDEVQNAPELFKALRGTIDAGRSQPQGTGKRGKGMYLLLGSASLKLIQQASESLAGRVSFVDLGGLNRGEVPQHLWDDLWLRGGFPESLLAASLEDSLQWRRDFLRTYLQRDMLQYAPRTSAERMRRFWTMLGHLQGTPINASDLARNLEVSVPTIGAYLELLVDLLLVRRLQPWAKNIGKRLSKTPKVFVRDTGLLHSLLGISTMDSLLSHPVIGASWEAHVIESLLQAVSTDVQASYYRSSGGAEVDLVLTSPSGNSIAIEIKRSTAPKISRGFYEACKDIKPDAKWLIHGGTGGFPMRDGVEAKSLEIAMDEVSKLT